MGEEVFSEFLKEVPFIGIGVLFVVWILRFHREERENRDKEWREWLQAVTFKFEVFLKDERVAFLNSVNDVSTKITIHDLNVAKVREDIMKKVDELEESTTQKITDLEHAIIYNKQIRKGD